MSKQKPKRKKSRQKRDTGAGSGDKRAQPDNSETTPVTKSSTVSKAKAGKKGRKPLVSKRRFLQLLIAIPAGGVAGAAIHRHDVNKRTLHNLADVGTGQPTVVQIHDPACTLCRRLMANTKTALDGKSDILYRVADVTSSKGAAFQRQYNVPNVTLLMFNGQGSHVGTIRGVTPVADLIDAFDALGQPS